MEFDYFSGVDFTGVDDLKNHYKFLCKKLHPDMPNGNEKEFITMKKQYETLISK